MWVSQIAKRRWYSSRSWPSRTHVCKSSGDSHARIEAGLRRLLTNKSIWASAKWITPFTGRARSDNGCSGEIPILMAINPAALSR